MAFSDWSVYQNVNPVGASVSIAAPLVATGSLDITGSLTDPNYVNLLPSFASAIPRAFTKGTVRTLIRYEAGTFIPANEKDFGILCMQSQEDLTLGVGAAYGGLAHAIFPAGFEFRIVKYNAGLTDTPQVLASTVVPEPYVIGTDIIALELEWVSDVINLGGVRLTLRRGIGALTDFSNLVTVLDIIDVPGPLTATTGEGLCFVDNQGAELNTALFDQTQTSEYV